MMFLSTGAQSPSEALVRAMSMLVKRMHHVR